MASVGGTMLASRAGAKRRAYRHANAGHKGKHHRARGKGHGAGAAGDIERIDCGRKHAHGSGGEHAAQGQGSQGTCYAKHRSLQQKCNHDGSAACAQGAHSTDIGAPAHHGNRHGVVNEEGSHQQRDAAEHAKIPAESRQHSPIGSSLRSLGIQQHARRQRLLQLALPQVEIVRSFRSLDEDAVDTPGFPGRQLRSPDVHQDGVRTDLRRVWNQARAPRIAEPGR